MTRRVASALLAVTGVALLPLAVPTSADAAQGVLIVNGVPRPAPSGCFDAPFEPLVVVNDTSGTAYVYDTRGCRGHVTQVVHPSHQTVSDEGASVYVR